MSVEGPPSAPAPPPGEPVDWTEAGPVSPRFGDIYFSAADGLEETRAVFLAGCGLPEAWRGRRRFTVGELGFGTGLNVLALLQLWAQMRPSPDARLSIVSVESYPLAVGDAARALARWPDLADLAAPILHRWPSGRRGLHRYDWPTLGATLDLIVDDVTPALVGWSGRADAWFLDGFAPAKNPQMWSDAVLAAVAEHSAPGARIATFTVAGAVRRGLAARGWPWKSGRASAARRTGSRRRRLARPPSTVRRPASRSSGPASPAPPWPAPWCVRAAP